MNNVNAKWTYIPREAVAHVANASPEEKVTFGIKVANSVRYSVHALQSAFGAMRTARPCEPLKVAFIPIAPLAIANIVESAKSIPGSSVNEKIDAALNIVASIGDAGDAVSSTAEGLASLGAFSVAAIAWATPLFVVSVALQCAGIVVTGKSALETHRFSAEFAQVAGLGKTVEEYTLEDYSKGMNLIESQLIKEKSFIAKHLGVNEELLGARLDEIEKKAQAVFADQSDRASVLECKQEMQNTMELLGKRLKDIKKCKMMTMLAGTISVIGIFILILGVCPPAGFALLAVAAGLYFKNFFTKKALTKQFELDLKFDEIRAKAPL